MTTVITRQPQFDHLRRGPVEKIIYGPARVGDRQRDQVTNFLGIAFSEGYLTRDELTARTGQALQALNEDRLAYVLHDLPDEIATTTTAVATTGKNSEGSEWEDVLLILVIFSALLFFALLTLLL